MGKPVVVGAFEAKTRLSELLREVERGASFMIQRRGKTVRGWSLRRERSRQRTLPRS